jgi:hypothetical protein
MDNYFFLGTTSWEITTSRSRAKRESAATSPMDRGREPALITGDIAFCAAGRRRLIGRPPSGNSL